ncbi:MAG TPA: sigma-54 dependent transcriptional regulator [Candidatus Hydrogenedens sp.]|nr:sigma-54 dependent transcriptional regulator [Candidatus Hydrogenedens sp.]HOL19069.1 sigma-54 dependent transcriptional regulator [Candidatus Hydrogenedens sp.]HPP57749.1 sigma-54 dependent transcriptional regulator [Candidatus Hydrogenedens sp.]
MVDDKESMLNLLSQAFKDLGFHVTIASSGESAIDLLSKHSFDIVLSDLSMPGKSGLDVLRFAKSISPEIEVIIITAYGTIDTAVEAMRLGAHDYITKPFQLAVLKNKVTKLAKQIEMKSSNRVRTWIHPSVQHLIGESSQTRQLRQMIARIAPTRSSVLITGPSGVGKELVARALHEASPRRDEPFIALNCAALAPTLLESELFGHEKGAFTGATSRYIGRFERAHKGTLFLDEVGDIDPGVQVKLLRVLQDGEFERVGGTETIKVDVRILAATNHDLRKSITQGKFREDFYYRLNVFSIYVPPLRERPEDIPYLVDHFLNRFSMEFGKELYEVDDEVIKIFLRYPWPGNIRELENVMERAVVLATGPQITINELPYEILSYADIKGIPEQGVEEKETRIDMFSLDQYTDQIEKELILKTLEEFHWNKTKTAKKLGIKRTTLQYKIKKLGLE